MDEKDVQKLRNAIKSYPDFPLKGILFQDIHPLMSDHNLRSIVTGYYEAKYKDKQVDVVVGLESRGYYFGIPLAIALGVPFVPIRKAGKLPGGLERVEYGKEYGKDVMEIQKDSIKKGQRVVLFDDLLATGGTIEGGIILLQKVGADILGCEFVIELKDLQGGKKIPQGVSYHSILQY
eukprot:TRINITY_DN2902_c0_g1_i1.p1 TRINITY_DN2902_c0_g1~~TRINITY_DN2902_c0_g1_i1.p1  ORF type:complete len:178 (+),score=67.89 TRINITY_DN2902_c0_g1_i1:106-639(+)